ncbi:HD-GYP domain-containing protein [Marinobacter sp.]|uniref:HD-GYP domain-containing protein n=1 Tax=Marinobacter sp. TaxID=50741 RepID=UPI00384E8BBA
MQSVDIVEKEIPAADVQLGMHVTRLDRPWTETDFPLQGFIVRSLDDIDAIREQCQTVFIEGRVSYRERLARKLGMKKATPEVVPQVTYINKIAFGDELGHAMETFHQCRNLAKNILQTVRLGRVIDLNEVRPVVKGVVASILRNHSALLWLTQIRHKDEYTAEHSMNVCVLSAAFGKHLGLEQSELESLALCGLLHDIGKIKVDDSVLNKPGAFTPAEFEHMKMHPVFGRQILMSVKGIEMVAIDVAHSHHERMDGKGYPRGLEQHQIPWFAKIVGIVDAYDAITGNRVYDSAKSSRQALDIIYKCRGVQFDDELSLEFIRFTGIYPPGSLIELSSGEIGLILESCPANRLRPRVLVVRNAEKEVCREKILDLMALHVDDGTAITVLREWPNGSFGVDLNRYLELGLQLRQHDHASEAGEGPDIMEYFQQTT